jgi:aminoglycoside phosphotransferase (APT) family kinase protein
MHQSSPSDDDLDSNVFGTLLSISETSIIQLAAKVFGAQTSNAQVLRRVAGSYNLVHIVQLDELQLVIRVPATGWGDGLTDDAARALESQVTTLRLLEKETTIPVPRVFAFDVSCDNEIGAPYLCMSLVPGRPVIEAWFDPACQSLEERRQRILATLAQHVAQLSKFRFERIGSPRLAEDGSLTVGRCYNWHENDDGSVRVVTSGPFDSTLTYLREHMAKKNTHSLWGIAAYKVVDAILPFLPSDVAEQFVLSIPDFDAQNVMVDDEGNVTGIIDWDLVQTAPLYAGYTSYPSFITRDWNPLMYGWPKQADSENSPEELERYRAYYNQQMGSALGQEGEWMYTEKSHITEAVWNAALDGTCRLEICAKLIQTAVGEEEDAMNILYDLGTGRLDKNSWRVVKEKLVRLVSFEHYH